METTLGIFKVIGKYHAGQWLDRDLDAAHLYFKVRSNFLGRLR